MTLWIIPESDREGGQFVRVVYTNLMRLPQMRSRPLWLRSLLGDLQVRPPPPSKGRCEGPGRFPEKDSPNT